MRYRFGAHTLDTATLQLLDATTEVELEPQALAVLTHLIEHRDRVVAKEELLDEVWGSRFVSESALATRIKQVRQAVGDSGRDQAVVRTFPGQGYRFVADVEVLDDAPRHASPPVTDRAPLATSPRVPTRYAEGDGASIAYQRFGEGPDLVLITGYATNVEAQWEHPMIADFLTRLGRFARVTILDKRGVGLSDRVPHDSVPPLETRADDLLAVMNSEGIERATVLGSSEGGSLSAVFTASHPQRVERLILHNTWVTGPEFPRAGRSDLDFVLENWGTGLVYGVLSPGLAADDAGREILARYERQSATPRTARHLAELIGEIDIAGILDAISVPTLVLHRVDDPIVPVDHGRRLAAGISGARLIELEGSDHYLFSGEPTSTIAAVRDFMGGRRDGADEVDDRVLATVLFVDVVDSTGTAQSLGDRRWVEQLDQFLSIARAEVEGGRGHFVNTTGDGLVATFDGPGRAVRTAAALRDAVAGMGLEIRAGLHTAEVQRRGDDIAGIGVHIASRVAAVADPGEVWVSRTVTDLVAGTGLRFDARGEHELKGIDQPWMLYAAVN
ncbi:MAG TPA: alpha/beta fold hydrolase [Microthrixaceae bacterium]|nr:alpha/beta fold hydrolase [Microthrixaceae bacterium]